MMKNSFLFCISTILSIYSVSLQAQGNHNFAIGDTTGTDYGYAIQPTTDGNILMAGKSSSFPPTPDYLYSDGFITKINPQTNAILWSKQYRLTVPQPALNYDRSDIFWSMEPVLGGNFIIGGMSADTTGLPNFGPTLVKIDGSGNPLWGRFLTGNGIGNQGYTCAYNASDDSYLLGGTILPVGGTQQAEAFVGKFDTDGNTIWIKTYGAAGSQVCRYLLPVTGGTLIIGITTPQSSSNTDIMVAKINTNGILQWTKTYGGLYEDRINGARILNDGNVLLTGFASRATGSGNESLLAMSINPTDGSLVWAKSYGTSATSIGNSVVQQATGASDVTIIGYTNATGAGGNDALVLKINTATGVVVDAHTFGSQFADTFVGAYYDATSMTSYYVGNTAGTDLIQGSDAFIAKTNGTGAVCPVTAASFAAATLTWTAASFTITTNTGVNAKNYPFEAFSSPFTKKDACYSLVATESEAETFNFTLAPNPSNGVFDIAIENNAQMSVFNSLGQLLKMQNLTAGTNRVDLQDLANGIYTVRLQTNDGNTTIKQMVKQMVKL